MPGFADIFIPIAQSIGGDMQRQRTLDDATARTNATNAGVDQILNGLGPEFQIFRNARAGGMPPSALAAWMGGPAGDAVKAAHKAEVIKSIFKSDADWTDQAKIHQAIAAGVMEPSALTKPPPPPTMIGPDGTVVLATPGSRLPGARTPTEFGKVDKPPTDEFSLYRAAHPNEPIDASISNFAKLKASPSADKPTPMITSETDKATGFERRYKVGLDSTGKEVYRTPMGYNLTATQKQGMQDSIAVLNAIPDAYAAGKVIEQKMNGMSVAEQRRKIMSEYNAYNIARATEHMDPWNPLRLRTSMYGAADPDFGRYFTTIGQIQQQTAAPMHIFRATGMFERIAPHIPVPTDLPAGNYERLRQLERRWRPAVDRLTSMDSGGGGSDGEHLLDKYSVGP